MWRLNMLKKEAWKSIVAFSPIRCVFFPIVRSSFLPPNARTDDKERGSLPNVKAAAREKAAGFQNGAAVGVKFQFFVWETPGTIVTRAPPPVVLHPTPKIPPAAPSQLSP